MPLPHVTAVELYYIEDTKLDYCVRLGVYEKVNLKLRSENVSKLQRKRDENIQNSRYY